jgi:REP element-mobilizing transposase RayT
MARLRRLVLPGYPYHVTQRGNRRSQSFFEDGDHELGEAARTIPVTLYLLHRCLQTASRMAHLR